MSKSSTVVNKSEEIRKILKANPKIEVKDVVAMLADKGIEVGANLVYLIRGKMPGKKTRRKARAQKLDASANGNGHAPAGAAAPVLRRDGDVSAVVRRVKSFAGEFGGLKSLKTLVDVLLD